MASNPVMSRNPYFGHTASNEVPRANTTYFNAGAAYDNTYGAPVIDENGQFYGTQAQAHAFAPTTVMTYDDAMVKTLILLLVAVGTGVAGITFIPLESLTSVAIISTLAAFGVGMFAAFKRVVGPGLAIAYAALEGLTLGSMTAFFNLLYPGIAFQAVLATIVVVGTAVGLHMSGLVRTTPKGRRFAMIAVFGAVIFSFVNWLLLVFGVLDGWGMSGGTLGIGLGILMIFVASYFLIGDLEDVKTAVANGAPAQFSWTCALGIVMTILWIYVEVLRILAIFNSND